MEPWSGPSLSVLFPVVTFASAQFPGLDWRGGSTDWWTVSNASQVTMCATPTPGMAWHGVLETLSVYTVAYSTVCYQTIAMSRAMVPNQCGGGKAVLRAGVRHRAVPATGMELHFVTVGRHKEPHDHVQQLLDWRCMSCTLLF